MIEFIILCFARRVTYFALCNCFFTFESNFDISITLAIVTNHSTTAPDNLLDAGALGAAGINTSVHGLGVADSANTTNADVGLLVEFESLTTGDLTAGEWVIAWSKAKSPLAYTQGLGD